MPVSLPSERSQRTALSEQDQLNPAASTCSSIELKPTGATLGETFSSGGLYDFLGSREGSNDVDGEYYGASSDLEFNEHPQEDLDHDDGGLEGYEDGTLEEDTEQDDDDTADLIQRAKSDPLAECYSSEYSGCAIHSRVENEFEVGLEWDVTESGSNTLATNLEGIDYVSEDLALVTEQPSHEEPQYYYSEEGYEQQEHPYYFDEGHYDEVPIDQEQFYYDAEEPQEIGHTLSNSSIETEPHHDIGDDIIQENFTQFHSGEEEGGVPTESYESEESGSTWGEDETRDMSLLDSRSQDDEEDESSDEDDEDDDRPRRRRPSSVVDSLLKGIQCTLKGSAVSDEDGDFEFLPDVAQVSTGATSLTSLTNSHSGESGQRRRRRRKKKQNLEKLFGKVSALGEELLAGVEGPPRRRSQSKGKRKPPGRRRRDRDPAARIVDSLRNIFSCGDHRF